MLDVQKISIAVKDRLLIENLSLTIGENDFVAVLGPSGCGKTTLLRALSLLDNPLSGLILFRGDLPEKMGYPQYRRHVVYVHQTPVMLDDTVEANLKRPFFFKNSKARFDESEAMLLLSELGLGQISLLQNAKTLSGGERQRIALVRSLLLKPSVLLLDEPTAALDQDNVGLVVDFLSKKRCQNLSVLMATHDKNLAETLCQKTIELKDYMPR